MFLYFIYFAYMSNVYKYLLYINVNNIKLNPLKQKQLTH